MPIQDPFSYSAWHDSVRLDCIDCRFFHGPDKWPDTERVSSCTLHTLSLSLELGETNYKRWEWFCRDFNNSGSAHKKSYQEFLAVKDMLPPYVLFRTYSEVGFLLEYPFNLIPEPE